MNIVIIFFLVLCVVVVVAMTVHLVEKKRQVDRLLMRQQVMGRRASIGPGQSMPPQPTQPLSLTPVQTAPSKPVPDFFQHARNSPFDPLTHLRSGDIDGARQALQKISYLVHADKKQHPDQVRKFTELMCMFAHIDPLFWRCLNAVKPVVQQSPGIRQTLLYEHMPVDVETARYVLYFAHETGHLVRCKKGNSYEVFLPEQPIPIAPLKIKRKRPDAANRKDSHQRKDDSMTKEQAQQLERFFTSQLGDGWQAGPFAHLNAEQTVEALWPMNEVFREHHAQIASLAYSPAFEAEADQALALLADGGNWSANNPSVGAWRVLYERHSQSLMLAAIKHAEGNARMVPIPRALPSSHHKIAVMLFLQWAMVLPFPVENKAAFAWPQGSAPGNFLRH